MRCPHGSLGSKSKLRSSEWLGKDSHKKYDVYFIGMLPRFTFRNARKTSNSERPSASMFGGMKQTKTQQELFEMWSSKTPGHLSKTACYFLRPSTAQPRVQGLGQKVQSDSGLWDPPFPSLLTLALWVSRMEGNTCIIFQAGNSSLIFSLSLSLY